MWRSPSLVTEADERARILKKILRGVLAHKFQKSRNTASGGCRTCQIPAPAIRAVHQRMAEKVLCPSRWALCLIKEIFFIRSDCPVEDMQGQQPGRQTLKSQKVFFHGESMGRLPGKMDVGMRQRLGKQTGIHTGIGQCATIPWRQRAIPPPLDGLQTIAQSQIENFAWRTLLQGQRAEPRNEQSLFLWVGRRRHGTLGRVFIHIFKTSFKEDYRSINRWRFSEITTTPSKPPLLFAAQVFYYFDSCFRE